MIFTARQVQDLHKASGQIVLPYRARLTPMAQDWLRAQRLTVGYSDQQAQKKDAVSISSPINSPGKFLYWCDGPCGPAKAALAAQAHESDLGESSLAADPKNLPVVLKTLSKDIRENGRTGGILLVQFGASAMVYANRCPSLRAVLGTCLESVEQGIQQVAANVMVIEYPYKTLQQIRNMLARFVKAPRQMNKEVADQLKELATCG